MDISVTYNIIADKNLDEYHGYCKTNLLEDFINTDGNKQSYVYDKKDYLYHSYMTNEEWLTKNDPEQLKECQKCSLWDSCCRKGEHTVITQKCIEDKMTDEITDSINKTILNEVLKNRKIKENDMTEHYEPLYSNETWMVKFELSEGMFPEELEPVKINRIEIKDGLCIAEDKAPSINIRTFNKYIKQELGKIEINFTDHSENESIRKFIDEWIEKYKPDFEKQTVNFFTLFEHDDEHSDNTNMSYRLKKPISKMTDEEKDFLKETLCNFGITDLSGWGL